MARTRKNRFRPWNDERMAGQVGWSVEAIHKRRVEAGFNYKELALPFGTFAGEDTAPAPVAPSWMPTIPLERCRCGNCIHHVAKKNQCDYIGAPKTATDLSCLHIWGKGNYIEPKEG